jgi:hypothetical protein
MSHIPVAKRRQIKNRVDVIYKYIGGYKVVYKYDKKKHAKKEVYNVSSSTFNAHKPVRAVQEKDGRWRFATNNEVQEKNYTIRSRAEILNCRKVQVVQSKQNSYSIFDAQKHAPSDRKVILQTEWVNSRFAIALWNEDAQKWQSQCMNADDERAKDAQLSGPRWQIKNRVRLMNQQLKKQKNQHEEDIQKVKQKGSAIKRLNKQPMPESKTQAPIEAPTPESKMQTTIETPNVVNNTFTNIPSSLSTSSLDLTTPSLPTPFVYPYRETPAINAFFPLAPPTLLPYPLSFFPFLWPQNNNGLLPYPAIELQTNSGHAMVMNASPLLTNLAAPAATVATTPAITATATIDPNNSFFQPASAADNTSKVAGSAFRRYKTR